MEEQEEEGKIDVGNKVDEGGTPKTLNKINFLSRKSNALNQTEMFLMKMTVWNFFEALVTVSWIISQTLSHFDYVINALPRFQPFLNCFDFKLNC